MDEAAALEEYRKDEARWASAQERLGRLMGIWGTTFNLMAAFAAPRVLAKVPRDHDMTQERVIGVFEDYIEMITGEKSGETFHGDEFHRTIEPTRRARAVLNTWVVSDRAPAPLVQAARDFFTAFGWAPPESGWEAWEGPPDDMPSM